MAGGEESQRRGRTNTRCARPNGEKPNGCGLGTRTPNWAGSPSLEPQTQYCLSAVRRPTKPPSFFLFFFFFKWSSKLLRVVGGERKRAKRLHGSARTRKQRRNWKWRRHPVLSFVSSLSHASQTGPVKSMSLSGIGAHCILF